MEKQAAAQATVQAVAQAAVQAKAQAKAVLPGLAMTTKHNYWF